MLVTAHGHHVWMKINVPALSSRMFRVVGRALSLFEVIWLPILN